MVGISSKKLYKVGYRISRIQYVQAAASQLSLHPRCYVSPPLKRGVELPVRNYTHKLKRYTSLTIIGKLELIKCHLLF